MQTNPKLIVGAAILVAVVGVILLLALVRPTTETTRLLPILATPTAPPNEGGTSTPVTVTFTELNSDPLAYLNKPIQVSGSYIKLDSPSCPRFTGPNPAWALVSEDLQLEAKGYERVIRILTPGTNMVVQGIWRFYQGPLGCGKGPTEGSSWYLQVQRIVQPNPLVGDGNANPIDIEGVNPQFPELLATEVPTLEALTTPILGTPIATATINQIVPTATITGIGTTDSTLGGTPSVTPVATNTPDLTGNTPVASPTANATATPGSGGGDNGPTSTPQTPLPPVATGTPGVGYPGSGTVTSTPTATTDPYP